MTIKMLVIIDPLDQIKAYKDSTYAIMLEAQKRDWLIYYTLINRLLIKDGAVFAKMQQLEIKSTENDWYSLIDEEKILPLDTMDITFIRKDPPFDLAYFYATIFIELAQKPHHLIINSPQGLRDANEKLFATWFPELCPPTMVASQMDLILQFLKQHKKIVLKPLDSMGGDGIVALEDKKPNNNKIIREMTNNYTLPVMAQKFLPNVKHGDKRILLIDGVPYPYALNRIPQGNDFRANLAVGGKGVGATLTASELTICEKVGAKLKQKGLFFVGIDVIDGYLTEINVTSPTCIREIDAAFNVNISSVVLDAIQRKINKY